MQQHENAMRTLGLDPESVVGCREESVYRTRRRLSDESVVRPGQEVDVERTMLVYEIESESVRKEVRAVIVDESISSASSSPDQRLTMWCKAA